MDRRQVYSIFLKLLTLLGVTIVMAVMINSLFPVEREDDQAAQLAEHKAPQTISVTLMDLQPGEVQFVQWQGKSVAVLRRNNVPGDFVKGEPLNQQWRSVKAEYFVYFNSAGVAQCPLFLIAGEDQLKDTCSGILYDSSGRRLRGTGNALQIPPHYFADETTLVIGSWSGSQP